MNGMFPVPSSSISIDVKLSNVDLLINGPGISNSGSTEVVEVATSAQRKQRLIFFFFKIVTEMMLPILTVREGN